MIDLVRKALETAATDHRKGYATVESILTWKASLVLRIREQPNIDFPRKDGQIRESVSIRDLQHDILDAVLTRLATLEQRTEIRQEYAQQHPLWYRLKVPGAALLESDLTDLHELFVEIILTSFDPEFPTIEIVNCHE